MNRSAHIELLKHRPFGWIYDDPPTVDSFPFERVDFFQWQKFMEENWKLSFYAGGIYLVIIFGLKEFMKQRKSLQLKKFLFLWNLSLGIFSIFGFTRLAPELLSVINQPNGLYNSICYKRGINAPAVYWGILFATSKFLELGDTVFIVLKKRPLVFLQWYHHVATLWMVWTVTPIAEPIIRWFATLNYGVHALMYPYFAFKTIGINIPNWIASIITTLQFTQMIIGFVVNATSAYLYQNGYDCVRHPASIKAFNILYGSFIILFGKLFYDSVLRSGRKKKEKVTKQK